MIWLLTHDVITFETKQLAQKSDEVWKRFLRRKTVVDVNESYTSKTMWDGSILKNLGGKASILFQGKRVNRDIHGARNILIQFLTKSLSSNALIVDDRDFIALGSLPP
ncbi:MAG: hypothetical protein QM487_03570 [Candidatus Marithrix sp.]